MVLSLAEVIHQNHLLTGSSAMQKSGVQLELAAHLMLMAHGSGSMVILRAGSPPNYDRPSAPKPGNIFSKSSREQGFFNGYLAAEPAFTRIERDAECNITVRGIHTKDLHRLAKPITNPDHLYTIQLNVTLKDILEQLKPNGDLLIKDFKPTTGQLELNFKPTKGYNVESKTFVIDFNKGKEFIPYFSRPWNAPVNKKQVPNELAQLLEKYISDQKEYFNDLTDKEFPVFIREKNLLRPAKIFSRTPQNMHELTELLKQEDPANLELVANLTFSQALQKLGADELENLYQKYALPITGDWDGLAIGHPVGLDNKYLKTYNTFLDDEHNNEIAELIAVSHELLKKFKREALALPAQLQNPFHKFILTINFHRDLCDEFRIIRAGIITPYEFLFEQLINLAYRMDTNEAFGEPALMLGLQESLNYVLNYSLGPKAPWNKCEPQREPNKLEIEGLITAAKIQLNKIRTKNINIHCCQIIKSKSEDHLEHTIRHVLNKKNFHALKHVCTHVEKLHSVKSLLKINHPDADPNIQNPFQHGVDMHSPYKPEMDGPWILITPDGMIIRGEKQCDLIAVLLSDDALLLKNSYFDVHPHIDMRGHCHSKKMNWGDVVQKQLEIDGALGLKRVSEATKQSYEIARSIQYLIDKYCDSQQNWELLDKQLFENILSTGEQHKQIIPPSLLDNYSNQQVDTRPRLVAA